MAFGPATPILRIFDEAKAKEFYCGFLGFGIDWEHRFGENLAMPWARETRITDPFGNKLIFFTNPPAD